MVIKLPENGTVTFDPDSDLVLVLSQLKEIPILKNKKKLRFDPPPSILLAGANPTRGTAAPEVKIRMIVSSKHMTLASPVFKAMFRSSFKEGEQLARTGRAEVPLPDDDPTAMALILYIIHGDMAHLPPEIPLQLLTNIAILVDKYQINKLLTVMSIFWVGKLKDNMPNGTPWKPLEVLQWITISWLFEMEVEFKLATRSAILGSTSEFRKQWTEALLPFPSSVVDEIEKAREKGIQKAFSAYNGLVTEYGQCGRNPRCTCLSSTGEKRGDCDAMVLGSLIRYGKVKRIWPLEVAQSQKYIHDTIKLIQEMKVTSLCQYQGYLFQRGSCAQRPIDLFTSSMNELKVNVKGMNLKDFKPKKTAGGLC